MDRYQTGQMIGEGAFGIVYLATRKGKTDNHNNSSVAIKRMKKEFTSWEGLRNMRELRALLSLPSHENIVQLLEVIREEKMVYFVFELMPGGSLREVMDHREQHRLPPLPEHDGISILKQVLSGVKHLHDNQIFHRDLKPENILLNGKTAKVADFSMARGIHESEVITSYVSTRWYRAPEILMMSKNYSTPADIFAIGCIFSEIHTGTPLFPGFDEIDQLRKIFSVLGSPTEVGWQEGTALLKKVYRVVQWPPKSIELQEKTSMQGDSFNLLHGML